MEKKVVLPYDASNKLVKVKDNVLRDFKDLFSGCRINFLLGAGFSAKILGILDNKEFVLESLKRYAKYKPFENIGNKDYLQVLAYMRLILH